MKKVNGMLSTPVTIVRYGPSASGTARTTLTAIASTIFVPDRMPVKMPAAKISEATAMALAACVASSSFCSATLG